MLTLLIVILLEMVAYFEISYGALLAVVVSLYVLKLKDLLLSIFDSNIAALSISAPFLSD